MFLLKSTLIMFVLFIIFKKFKLYDILIVPIVIPAGKAILKLIIKIFRLLIKEARERTEILKNTKLYNI